MHTVFPFYHCVSDVPVPHLRNLYMVRTKKEFLRDLDFLLMHYTPLHPNEIQAAMERTGNKKPGFLLTFDDGLSEFYSVIAPVLLAKGIPAICFINTGFVDNRDLFYRYKASVLIEHLRQKNLSAASIKAVASVAYKYQKRFDAEGKFLLTVKFNQQELLDKMAGLTGIDFGAYLNQRKPYMTTEEIKALIKQGFCFGAHSINHPEFSAIPPAEQLRQVKESMQFIEQTFGCREKFYSFPFTDNGVSPFVFKAMFSAQQPIVDWSFGCAGLKRDSLPRHLQRIAIERGNYPARQILVGEYLYYCAKALVGKNTLHN